MNWSTTCAITTLRNVLLTKLLSVTPGKLPCY
jgi:hypothetical protein